jgi:hypothetical protein
MWWKRFSQMVRLKRRECRPRRQSPLRATKPGKSSASLRKLPGARRAAFRTLLRGSFRACHTAPIFAQWRSELLEIQPDLDVTLVGPQRGTAISMSVQPYPYWDSDRVHTRLSQIERLCWRKARTQILDRLLWSRHHCSWRYGLRKRRRREGTSPFRKWLESIAAFGLNCSTPIEPNRRSGKS